MCHLQTEKNIATKLYLPNEDTTCNLWIVTICMCLCIHTHTHIHTHIYSIYVYILSIVFIYIAYGKTFLDFSHPQKPPTTPPTPCFHIYAPLPNTLPPPSLTFLLLGPLLCLFLTKDHSYHWCPRRPPSATVFARTVCSPSLMDKALWVLELQCGRSHCSAHGAINTFLLLQTILQHLHWEPHAQSNSWFLDSASVFVRFWQGPSGDNHGMLLLV